MEQESLLKVQQSSCHGIFSHVVVIDYQSISFCRNKISYPNGYVLRLITHPGKVKDFYFPRFFFLINHVSSVSSS